MKKSFIKKSFFSSFILILVFALASCSNWFESSVDEIEAKIEEELNRQTENQSKPSAAKPEEVKIDFYGNMFFTGAMPEIVADEIQQAADNVNDSNGVGEVNARAALPEIDESQVEYFVRAVDTDDNTINGTFPDNEHPSAFSLYLIYGKTYTITCGMKKTGTGGAEFLTATSDSITVTTSNASDPLVFYPEPATGGLGEVDLEMSVPPSITNVTVFCTGTNSTDWKINTVDFTAGSGSTNGSAKLETGSTDVEKIPAGVYNIILNFYKGDEVVFTTQQKINIFTGLKTNLWKDSSSLAVTSKAIQNDGSFVLTENIIKLYLSTQLYVNAATGNDSNSGNHHHPLASFGEAIARISEYGDETNDYTIHISGEQKPAASATSGFEIPDTFNTKIKTLTICGVNNRETDILDGDARFCTLKINSSKNVTIKDLTIRNGNQITTSLPDGGFGGGIQKFGSGQLTVDNCIIRGNTAVKGGGGICCFQNAGDCKIKNCLIESNTAAESNGGGLYSRAETDIINTIIKSNSAAVHGGGIFATDKPLKIYGSQTLISENTASGRGGGINSDVPVIMTSGTITGNKSLGTAEDNTCGGGGVAIKSTFEMKGGLIKDNYASVFGGGVFIFDVNAKLFLSGNAVIGDITQDSPAESDNDKHSNSSGKGGGIFNRGKIYAGYTDESTPDPSFSGGIGYNYASIHGGGIYSIGSGTAEVYIYKAKISENTSETFGGGFDIYNGTIEINNSIIENNKGGKGGGINLGRADGSPISVIKNTNITNNLSTSRGGGILFLAGSLTMSDVQITDNHSDVTGGGFFNEPTGTKTLTFGSNAAESTVTIKNNTQGAAEPYAKSNIYLNATDVITVAGALSSTSEIWVSSATSSGTFTDGFGTTNSGTTPSSIFKSDEDLEIYADSDGEASFTDETISLENVTVPSGTFDGTTTTGSTVVFTSGRNLGTIKSLIVSDHETTQGEYELYCKYGGTAPGDDYGDGEYYPAYYVSWYDAIVYCNLRSIADHLDPVYYVGGKTDPAQWAGIVSDSASHYCAPSTCDWYVVTDDTKNGWRLPYEAEWEYVWREKNLTGTDQHTYCGGEDPDLLSWNTSTSSGKSHIVKTKGPNSLEIYDMCGNVWEWMNDWHSYPVPVTTPITGVSYENADPKMHVTRGGGWRSDGTALTMTAARNRSENNARFNDLGFRVVRNAETTTEAYPKTVSTSYIGSKTPAEVREVGDIIFTDGSAVPYTDSLTLTDDQKAAAIAVIFYKGNGLNREGDTSIRTLGVGLLQKANQAWAITGAKAIGQKNEAIIGDKTSGDKYGKDNYTEIKNFLVISGEDDTDNLDNYPAFKYVTNYKNEKLGSETTSRLIGTDFEDDWYLPTMAELYKIYLIKDMINNALDACGGSQMLASYWSSNQNNGYPSNANNLAFASGNMTPNGTSMSNGYQMNTRAIREF